MNCGLKIKHLTQIEWIHLESISIDSASPRNQSDSRVSELADGTLKGGFYAEESASIANDFSVLIQLSKEDLEQLYSLIYQFGAGFWALDMADFSFSGADISTQWILQLEGSQELSSGLWQVEMKGYK